MASYEDSHSDGSNLGDADGIDDNSNLPQNEGEQMAAGLSLLGAPLNQRSDVTNATLLSQESPHARSLSPTDEAVYSPDGTRLALGNSGMSPNMANVTIDTGVEIVQVDPNGPYCLICGDRGSGYHYSVFSCEGCKGFFKRTVQKNLNYACKEHQSCVVNKYTRNNCQYCRYQKCLSVGMKRDGNVCIIYAVYYVINAGGA